MAVSVTSKGQVTIPKRVREALGITPGSKVEFDIAGGGAQLKLVGQRTSSCIEEGAAIRDYKGPRIPVAKMHGWVALKKAAKRARGYTNILARSYLRDDARPGHIAANVLSAGEVFRGSWNSNGSCGTWLSSQKAR